MKIRGNDKEGMQAWQAEWIEWSESLPKKTEEGTTQPGDQQRGTGTTDTPLPPPPRVESPNLPPVPQPSPSYSVPPPPRQDSTVWRGTKLAFGGCIVLPVLLLLGFIGCVAVLGSGGGGETGSKSKDSKSGVPKGGHSTVATGEPVTVGDVVWTVTDAGVTDQLSQPSIKGKSAPSKYGKTEQGNFVVVDFDFTNNGSDPVSLDNNSLALIDSEGRESKTEADFFPYIPEDRRIFLERVNPGVMDQGRAIFEVASGASGFQLQAGDTVVFSDENGYVDLGF